jgi:hypothetical protein
MSVISEAAVDRVRDAMFRETGGRPVSARQRAAMRIALVAEATRLNPAAGRFAATAQADQVAKRVIGPNGTVKPSDATRKRLKAARKAAKKVKQAARESEIRRQITESLAARGITIRETLTAAQGPQSAPGSGIAPASGVPQSEELAALGAGHDSPFWRPRGPETAEVPDAPKPLHEMGTDEFRAYAEQALTAHGRSHGFRSPVWQ